MEKLFGIPTDQLMAALLALFGLGVAVATFVALRNPIIFKLAARNIPRRRAQTALIVLGLMLATLLFSAAFATGDTLTTSIRVDAVRELGQVDISVRSAQRDVRGRPLYLDAAVVDEVRAALADTPLVDGVAPQARETAPVLAPATRLSEPRVDVLGLAPRAQMAGFDPVVDAQGQPLDVDALAPGQVYISEALAGDLDVGVGGTVQVFLGPVPAPLEVAGVFQRGAHPAGELALVLPLGHLQELTGNPGKVNAVLISNRGGAVEGGRHTDAVVEALTPLLERARLEADELKKDALERADRQGSTFSSIFLLFGQFSVAAGILLIFLIFVMLAAERKHELGIARAVGAQQGHVVRMFTYEGALYAIMAAAVGSLLGVVVGWAMVRITSVALADLDVDLTFAFHWRSVVIAYTLGMVLTFAVVLVSSWRVSRLNIVRAVRDIPEPPADRRGLAATVLVFLLPVLGVLLLWQGLAAEATAPYMLGSSLVIIGVPLVAQRFGLGDRAAYTIAGVGLVAWWLVGADLVDPLLPEMSQGIEMFFLTGVMIVVGAVWAVVYNTDLLLRGIVLAFGRIRGLPPVLKTAVSYPMQNRFRTGMTLAMFSLVVFTLVVMAFIIKSIYGAFDDTERLAGGYHIRALVSYTNPITDIHARLEEAAGVGPEQFQAIGSYATAPVKVRQEGVDREPVDFALRGVDQGFSDSVTYGFSMYAPGYSSPRQVWEALQREPGTAVVAAFLVPTRANYNVGGTQLPFALEGFYKEDGALPEVYIQVTNPTSGREERLRVIAVLQDTAFYGGALVASQQTLSTLMGQPVPAQAFMLRLAAGQDAQATARALEAAFLEHGVQAQVLDEEIRASARANQMLNNLLQGFMGLGLVVGIAALGVIAARSVVERRQQIGVLRALGFQRGMVQAAFLIESSFVALLGIAIGIGLGMGLSGQVIREISKDFEGVRYAVPWFNLALVVVIGYGAALLTTFLPARQAANVYPAEALRFE